MNGRFVTLEGGEGVGKSTQARALAAALEARGMPVLVTREPGGSPGAEAIRKLLLEGEVDRWSAEAEALLFAAARSDHVTRTIRPALEAGKWVICDRFIDSSLAYQGGAGGVGIDAVTKLHEIGSQGLLPDRTLLLEMPQFDASFRTFARDHGQSDRVTRRGEEYHGGVGETFHALADRNPGRYRVISAEGTIDEVTARLLAALEDLL